MICFAAVAAGTSLRAEIRNFAFEGVVNAIDDNHFYLDDSVSTGTPIEGFYIFDSSTSDSNSDETVGDYQHNESTFGIVVKIGNYVFRTDPEQVDFLMEIVDRDTDHYLLHSYNNLSSRPLMVEHISWQLDGPATALTNDFLFSAPPVLTNFPGQSFNVVGPGEAFSINAIVTSIRENPAVITQSPAITLHPAVEITWPAQFGYFYHIQSSTNMTDWENIGEPILADGTELSKFVRSAAVPTFYRAEIKNFSAGAVPSPAEIRNFAFEGVVVDFDNPDFFVDESIDVETPVEGFYIFDSSTPDSNPSPTVGDYQHDASTFGIVVKIGNYVFRTNPEHVDFLVEIVNGSGDNYLLRSYNNLCSGPLLVEHIAWQLDGPSTALTNDFLPSSPPVITNYSQIFGLTIQGSDNSFFIRANVTSIKNNPAIISQAPAVTLSSASEIQWPAQIGYFYRIQSSTNMTDWENIGEPILADSQELSKFVRAAAVPTFYRAEIKNFSEE